MTGTQRVQCEEGKKLENPEAIAMFEESHGIKLPLAYREIVLAHDGAYLEPAGFVVDDPIMECPMTYSCDLLLNFTENDIQYTNDGNVEGLPPDVIAFGIEGGGYKTCFDYRLDKTTDNPPIVLFISEYDDDNCLIPVAPDFDTFLANLVEQP